MSFSTIKSHFKYTTSQRAGIVLLLTLIIAFQLFYYFADFTASSKRTVSVQKERWLSLQTEIDKAKKEKEEAQESPKIYPFNPNFITDFRGYKLGMSTQEIDRLLAFRKTNKYVNSAQEFQAVTQISDSLLRAIAPYFKFPTWVHNTKEFKKYPNQNFAKKERLVVLDINRASQEDLKKIYGIGDGLSERILKEKEKFGAFVSMEQMNDVWGLSAEVVAALNEHFRITAQPDIKKININTASIKELMQFPYFKYPVAKSIITYRSMHGGIKNIEDLIKIKGFPIEKSSIIVLYLEF